MPLGHKGVLLQTSRLGGTPGDMLAWPIIGGRSPEAATSLRHCN